VIPPRSERVPWPPRFWRQCLGGTPSAGRGADDGVHHRVRPAEGAAHGQRTGVGFCSAATLLRAQGRPVLHPGRITIGQRLHRIVQQPAAQGVSQPQPMEQPVRSPGGHRRLQTRAQPSPPSLSPRLANTGRVRRGVRANRLERSVTETVQRADIGLRWRRAGLVVQVKDACTSEPLWGTVASVSQGDCATPYFVGPRVSATLPSRGPAPQCGRSDSMNRYA
jgi:hypothetical protein